MVDLVARGSLRYDTLHSSLFTTRDGAVQHIDLGGLTWIDPVGLVAAAALIDRCKRTGGDIDFRPPTDESRANYLARMGLVDLLEEWNIPNRLPNVRRHFVGDRLLELQSFDSVTGTEALARHVEAIVAPTSDVGAAALYAAVSEAGQNIAEHAGVASGFFAAQTVGQGALRFAVGDGGVGFLDGGLVGRGAKTDEEALHLAIGDGISRFVSDDRGYGLSTLAHHLRDVGGELTVASGRAYRVEGGMRRTRGRSHIIAMPGSVLEGFIPPRL